MDQKKGNGMRDKLSCIRIILILLLFGVRSISGIAQPDTVTLKKTEQLIQSNFRKVVHLSSDPEKESLGDTIFMQVRKELSFPGSFTYPFDTLSYIGKLTPKDSAFRLINWTIPMSDGTHLYYLLFQVPDTIKDRYRLFPIKKRSTIGMISDSCRLTSEQWYGAVYYQVLVNSSDTGKIYTLLGLDLNDFFTTRKVIDILSFDKEGIPVFGAPVFQYPDHISYRVIFEFSAQVSMMLRFEPAMNMIVFDHLSPSDPRYKGVYQYYGPDFSYDGFSFKEGKWIFHKDLDIRNQSSSPTGNR